MGIIENEIYLTSTDDVIYEEDLVVLKKEPFKKLLETVNPGTPIKSPNGLRVVQRGEQIRYIWGAKGTGKTTMLKMFKQSVDGVLAHCIYINARDCLYPTHLIEEFRRKLELLMPDVSPDTSSNPQEYSNIMSKNDRAAIVAYIKYLKETKKQVWFLLDEIDKPLRNSNNVQADEFLHFLLRVSMEDNPRFFKFIFSTNIINIERMLSPEVLSVIRGNKVWFHAYTLSEVAEILFKRCQRGLKEGTYSKEDLYKIAKLNDEFFDSDIRTALKCLFLLSTKSEAYLDFTKLDEVVSEINEHFLRDEILSMARGAQILLTAILENTTQQMPYFTTDQAAEFFSKICSRLDRKMVQKTMFYKYFGILQDHLIVRKTSGGYLVEENSDYLRKIIEDEFTWLR